MLASLRRSLSAAAAKETTTVSRFSASTNSEGTMGSIVSIRGKKYIHAFRLLQSDVKKKPPSKLEALLDMSKFVSSKMLCRERYRIASAIPIKYAFTYAGMIERRRPNAPYRTSTLVYHTTTPDDLLDLWVDKYELFSQQDRIIGLLHLGKMALRDPSLRNTIVNDERYKNLIQFIERDVVNVQLGRRFFSPYFQSHMARALMFLNDNNNTLLSFCESEVLRRPWDYSGRLLSLMLCTFAEFERGPKAMWKRVALDGPYRMKKFCSDYLPDLLYAYSRSGMPGRLFFDNTARYKVYSLEKYYPASFARIVSAFAIYGSRDHTRFFKDCMYEFNDKWFKSPYTRPSHLATMAWSLASLGASVATDEGVRFHDNLGRHFKNNAAQYSSQDIGDVVWAFAVNDIPCEGPMNAASIELTVTPDRFEKKDLERIRWGFERLGRNIKHTPALCSVASVEHPPDTKEVQISRDFYHTGRPHWNLPMNQFDTDNCDYSHFRFKRIWTDLVAGTLRGTPRSIRRWKLKIEKMW